MIILTDIWHQSFQTHLENTLTAVYSFFFFPLFKSSNERHYLKKKNPPDFGRARLWN